MPRIATLVHRPVQIVVPFKLSDAKSRLAPALAPEERRLLAFAMLRDVLGTVSGFGKVTILSRPGLDAARVGNDVEVVESELDLNDALNALIADEAMQGWPSDILIVMADLALLTQKDVAGILELPGRCGALSGKRGRHQYDPHQGPRVSHLLPGAELSQASGLCPAGGPKGHEVFESFRAGCDIDCPEDLAEVLLHGRGESRAFLEKIGYSVSEKGR